MQTDQLVLLGQLLANPNFYLTHPDWRNKAALLPPPNRHIGLVERKEYVVFGAEHIEQGAIHQMKIAMKLPVTVAGAPMPDAHYDYGLPVGGVLATDNTVILYAVGVDWLPGGPVGVRFAAQISGVAHPGTPQPAAR